MSHDKHDQLPLNLQMPSHLPVPVDDGACDHLVGMRVPSIVLPATSGASINLTDASEKTTVVYCYPRTGLPGKEMPEGWDGIPGARGCTPQSCAFRDHHQELMALNARVFGLSTQTTAYQTEAAERLHLPFPLLSDADLTLTNALSLPIFMVEEMVLIKRLTMIFSGGVIEKVFYPVFPPDKNAGDVIAYLRQRVE